MYRSARHGRAGAHLYPEPQQRVYAPYRRWLMRAPGTAGRVVRLPAPPADGCRRCSRSTRPGRTATVSGPPAAAAVGPGAAGGPDNDGLSRKATGLTGEPGEDADADADAGAGGGGGGEDAAGGRGAAGVTGGAGATGGGVPLVGFLPGPRCAGQGAAEVPPPPSSWCRCQLAARDAHSGVTGVSGRRGRGRGSAAGPAVRMAAWSRWISSDGASPSSVLRML